MSRQYLARSWNQVALGVAMLVGAALPAFICLSNKIGLGKAVGLIILSLFIAAWVIAGAILIARGLSKM